MKPSLYYKLYSGTRYPFVLDHPIVNSHFWYKTEYLMSKKLDSHSPTQCMQLAELSMLA